MIIFREARRSLNQSLKPWYTDFSIERKRDLEKDTYEVASSEKARYILLERGKGIYHEEMLAFDGRSAVKPLFLTFANIEKLLGDGSIKKNIENDGQDFLLVWVGKIGEVNYWSIYLESPPSQTTASCINTFSDKYRSDESYTVRCAPLREFGDNLESRTEATLLGTANGLVEFHKSHKFCSKCGGATVTSKAGACRRCESCRSSVYPRIDGAAIMLITTQCKQYALLGRKSKWPTGRYSTLAGFAEVGESLEQCCARETLEESGIQVDLDSVRFVASQPWPFPRSLMIGFRGEAIEPGLPKIRVDEEEMEDIRWFAKDYVAQRLEGGSTALGYQPSREEEEFHLPGKASLARLLISQWAKE